MPRFPHAGGPAERCADLGSASVKSHVVPSGPLPPTSFRAFVGEELARRCARNEQYSLRAFAVDLCLDHSSLSQLLRGRRRWSERAIRETGARLGLAPERIEGFVARERSGADPLEGSASGDVVRSLTQDALAVMSSFVHEALLELTHLDDFRPDSRWIARVLDVSVDEVNVALQQLLRLGMLGMEGERWVDRTGDRTLVHTDLAHETLRRLTERVRRHALRAGGGERDYSSTLLSVDRRQLPEVLERLARFRRDLLAHLARGERRDEVYHLELSFLPVTRDCDDAADAAPTRSPDPEE